MWMPTASTKSMGILWRSRRWTMSRRANCVLALAPSSSGSVSSALCLSPSGTKSSTLKSSMLWMVGFRQCMGWELVAAQAGGGWWSLLLNNSGVLSMHTAVTRYNTMIFLDQTDIGPTNLTLANGVCRNQPLDRILSGHDCWANSAMFRTDMNTVRPLFIFTDTWCSSGQFFSDGTYD